MKKYAYVRVSTKEQNIDRQLKALEPYDIPKKNIYCDYQSGKDFERPEYKKMLKKIRENDLLIIKSIDRLGRNYNEILAQWQYITKQLKADILVLDMDLLDTREKAGNLTGTLIADLEGIAAAKDKGKKWGRKPMEMPEQFEQICQMCIDGKITTRKAAEFLGVSHTTFYRRYRENVTKTAKKAR